MTFRKIRGDSWVGIGRPELKFGTQSFVNSTHMLATSDRRVFEEGAWRGNMLPPVPVGSNIRIEWDCDRGIKVCCINKDLILINFERSIGLFCLNKY